MWTASQTGDRLQGMLGTWKAARICPCDGVVANVRRHLMPYSYTVEGHHAAHLTCTSSREVPCLSKPSSTPSKERLGDQLIEARHNNTYPEPIGAQAAYVHVCLGSLTLQAAPAALYWLWPCMLQGSRSPCTYRRTTTVCRRGLLSAHGNDCIRNRQCVIAFTLALLLCRHGTQ